MKGCEACENDDTADNRWGQVGEFILGGCTKGQVFYMLLTELSPQPQGISWWEKGVQEMELYMYSGGIIDSMQWRIYDIEA